MGRGVLAVHQIAEGHNEKLIRQGKKPFTQKWRQSLKTRCHRGQDKMRMVGNWSELGVQSSSCFLSPPDRASLGSPSAASSFTFASDRFPCGTAGSPRPHRALCSASFFGSQCGGNGLIGSIDLWFTRPTLKYVLWSRKNCFQCSTLCQKEVSQNRCVTIIR